KWAEKISPLTEAQTDEWLKKYNANQKYNKTTFELRANKIKRVRNRTSPRETGESKGQPEEKPSKIEKKFPPAIEEELIK
ncbi:MAG: hypothetical protein FWC60_04375, partial [Firmicutes bacterium]|nr:hypothetical protein [Bacillota bacterium]